MLARLRHDLVHFFMGEQKFSTLDCSAINLALFQLVHAPYFEGGGDHFVLVGEGDQFFTLRQERYGELKPADPLMHCYRDAWDDSDSEDPPPSGSPLLRPAPDRPKPTSPLTVDVQDLPLILHTRAADLLDRFLGASPQWCRLFEASPEQLERRHDVVVEHFFGAEDLHNRLRDILGPDHDVTLGQDGIQYHRPVWSWHDPDHRHRYILAHNGEEVAGLLHYLDRPHEKGLSFVSVAPGFQHHGLSQRLYAAFIDVCIEEQCLLKRSSPSDFALANPQITAAYDRMVLASPVLHISSSGRTCSALQVALQTLPYEQVFAPAKRACDEALKLERARGSWMWDGGQEDRTTAEALLAQLSASPVVPAPLKDAPASPRQSRRRSAP